MKKLMTILTMRTTMKNTLALILAMLLAVGFISANTNATESETIATFEDPSANSSNPLFTVVFATSSLNGSITSTWGSGKTGLTLEIPKYSGPLFENVWFDMAPVTIYTGGTTGAGMIRFFEEGDPITADPLVKIEFTSAFVSRFSFGAENDEIAPNNVTITCSKIIGELSGEQFAFSFANKKKLPGQPNQTAGFTATSAFSSSAMVPEPATVCILSLGTLSLIRRKKH